MIKLHAAIALAQAAHGDAVDKRGELYVSHPLRVMAKVAEQGEDYAIVAVLHDVLEDTKLTWNDLGYHGVPSEMRQAIWLLTRWPEMGTYMEYIDAMVRAAARGMWAGEVAVAVKIADIEDNLQPSRDLGEESASLRKRYEKALDRLRGITGPIREDDMPESV